MATDNNNSIDNFIRSQDAENTIKSNEFGHNVLHTFLISRNELRPAESIPAEELDTWICKFFY